MTDRTALGDRMKLYESAESGRRLMPLLPICARLDGKGFSRYTAGLARPFDPRLTRLMVEVTTALVRQTQALIGYTQSDEISLLYHSDTPGQQLFLDGRLQKLTSILAAIATAEFNARVPDLLPERVGRLALFDARVWNVPNREEAANTFLWREIDATRNSLSMATRHHYPHEVVFGKDGAAMHQLLHEVGVNWNDYPPSFKRGTWVRRTTLRRPFSADELEALPPLHDARRNPDLVVERHEIRPFEMPPFGRVRNRVAVLFEGAEPDTSSPETANP